MVEVRLRRAVLADAARLEPELRPADRAEVIAASGPDVLRTLEQSVQLSLDCWAAEDADGGLIALFGIAPVSMLSGIGSIWMLGTPRADRLRSLTRITRRYLAAMATDFPVLMNYADARNVRSIRWLKRLGFTVHPPEPYGVAGLPFHRFSMGE